MKCIGLVSGQVLVCACRLPLLGPVEKPEECLDHRASSCPQSNAGCVEGLYAGTAAFLVVYAIPGPWEESDCVS